MRACIVRECIMSKCRECFQEGGQVTIGGGLQQGTGSIHQQILIFKLIP